MTFLVHTFARIIASAPTVYVITFGRLYYQKGAEPRLGLSGTFILINYLAVITRNLKDRGQLCEIYHLVTTKTILQLNMKFTFCLTIKITKFSF
jgi:hypothetical protein